LLENGSSCIVVFIGLIICTDSLSNSENLELVSRRAIIIFLARARFIVLSGMTPRWVAIPFSEGFY